MAEDKPVYGDLQEKGGAVVNAVREKAKPIFGTMVEKGGGAAKTGAGAVGKVFSIVGTATGTSVWAWIIVLILLLIGVYALWVIGSAVVGFFFTALGMLCIGLFVAALVLFLYMRWAGFVHIKGWGGAIIIVLILFIGLFIFVGCLDFLTSAFFSIMPILVLGGGAFIGYKLVMGIKDNSMKTFAIMIVILLVITVPVMEMFIVPKTFGKPLEIKATIMRSSDNRWSSWCSLGEYQPIQTMTTSLNPYYIGVAEVSHLMWQGVGTTQKVYCDIFVEQHTGDAGTIYTERGKAVYISADSQENIWGMCRIPFNPMYAEYKVDFRVYDAGGSTLTETTFIYTTGG